jgi:hypothetical protein
VNAVPNPTNAVGGLFKLSLRNGAQRFPKGQRVVRLSL